MTKHWKIILSFAVVFGAGALVGSLTTKCTVPPPPPVKDKPREEFAVKVMRRYVERLQLTDEQVALIRPIVEKAGQDMKDVRTVWFRDTREVAEKMNQDVAAILTPEQKIEYAQYLKELHARWDKMSHRKTDSKKEGAPPPPPPRN